MGYGKTECDGCGREFMTSFTTDSEELEGWTRSEDHPDEVECDFCKGEETCSVGKCQAEATVLDKDGDEIYCAMHWGAECKANGETVMECEEFILRRAVPYTKDVVTCRDALENAQSTIEDLKDLFKEHSINLKDSDGYDSDIEAHTDEALSMIQMALESETKHD